METTQYPQKIEHLVRIACEVMPKLPYHNFGHAIDVHTAVNTLAHLASVDGATRFLLKSAALLHDIIYVRGAKDNEERSAVFARERLPPLGYSAEDLKLVERLIMATKMPQRPSDYLEQLICDADLDNLGRADFFERGENLREEMDLEKNPEYYARQLQFLAGHSYHTGVARSLRDAGKRQNIASLEKMLADIRQAA